MKNYQLKDCKNNLVNLSDLVGEKGLVIFFYPKAKTGLCTLEALEYQKHLSEFKNKGYNVVGVLKILQNITMNFVVNKT